MLKGVNFHIMHIFQNDDLEKNEEMGSIEDQNRANQNNKKNFKPAEPTVALPLLF